MALSAIPPGISFLVAFLPRLFAPPLLVYVLLHVAPLSTHPLLSSDSARIALYVLAAPIFIAVRINYLDFVARREAKKLGAELVPTMQGKWPGNLDLLLRMMRTWDEDYMGEFLKEMGQKHGNTVNARFLWDNFIFTTEPDNIKAILASNFANYEKGAPFMQAVGSFLGTGVFASDGAMWKFHRSITRPFFSKERITDFEIFTRHADHAIALLKRITLERGEAADIQDMTGRFTLDSATEFLFGNNVRSLEAPLPVPRDRAVPSAPEPVVNNANNAFSDALASAQHSAVFRVRLGPVWPLLEMFGDRCRDAMQVLYGYIDPIVKVALEEKRRNPPVEGEKEGKVGEGATLLSHMVALTDDKSIIRDELINLLMASRDTTTITLTVAIYMLAMHPECLARLRSEILSTVGPTATPTYDDIRSMKYLRAVLNETLRLFPPVPFNFRQSINATTWPKPDGTGKYYIPPRTPVTYGVYLTHRRKDLWGPTALDFDPLRFLDERVQKYLVPNPFIFIPFNAGPRICLGQQFAYSESSLFLVRFLQSFGEVRLAPEAQSLDSIVPSEKWARDEAEVDRAQGGRAGRERFWPKSHLTLYSHGGLWVRLGKAPEDGGEGETQTVAA